MARRIVWTERANAIFVQILHFYNDRNRSKTYSNKLLREVNAILHLLKRQPFLGSKTDLPDIRVVVTKIYKIFYRIEPKEIVVILIWDNREDPDNPKMEFD